MSSQEVLIERDASVDAALSGARCDQAAAVLFAEFSRSRLKTWILGGQLVVNGKPCRPRDKLQVGDLLSLSAAPEPEGEWQAQAIDLAGLPVIETAEVQMRLDAMTPTSVVSHGLGPVDADSWPINGLVEYQFAGTEFSGSSPFACTWYDGNQKPPAEVAAAVGGAEADRIHPGEIGIGLIRVRSGTRVERCQLAVERPQQEGICERHMIDIRCQEQ